MSKPAVTIVCRLPLRPLQLAAQSGAAAAEAFADHARVCLTAVPGS